MQNVILLSNNATKWHIFANNKPYYKLANFGQFVNAVWPKLAKLHLQIGQNWPNCIYKFAKIGKTAFTNLEIGQNWPTCIYKLAKIGQYALTNWPILANLYG
jgi:hypothetical protein